MYHSVMSRMPLGRFSPTPGTLAISPNAVPPKAATPPPPRSNIVAPRRGGNVPFRDVANAFGALQSDPGYVGDIAERRAAEGRHHRSPRGGGPPGFPFQVRQILFGNRLEFLQVIGGV